MSDLAALLAAARAATGEVRRFSLARTEGLDKHARFALPTPAQYACELVAAGVFAGATAIAVETARDGITVAWTGGRPFSEAQLGSLVDGLFVDPGAPEHRAWFQLAVACNHLVRERGAAVRVESGPAHLPVDGTWIRATWRAGWRIATGPTPEAVRLAERCQYAPVPILLDGDLLFGWRRRLPEVFGAAAQRAFDEDGCRGVLALPRRREDAAVRVVVGGVWVADLDPAVLAGRPITGVLLDDRLRRTADLRDVVRDGAWERLIAVARPVATALIRAHHVDGARYVPPGGAPPSPEMPTEIPASLPGLPPRGEVRLADHDPARPLYVVDPEHARALAAAADPARLDAAIPIADAAQRAALARVFRVVRLARATDVALAARALERTDDARPRPIDVPPFARAVARLDPRRPAEWVVASGEPPISSAVGSPGWPRGLRITLWSAEPAAPPDEAALDRALAAAAAAFGDDRLVDAARRRHARWIVGAAGPALAFDGLPPALLPADGWAPEETAEERALVAAIAAADGEPVVPLAGGGRIPRAAVGEAALWTESRIAPPGMPLVPRRAWGDLPGLRWWLQPVGPSVALDEPGLRGWIARAPPGLARLAINDRRLGPWSGVCGQVRVTGPRGRLALALALAELGVAPPVDTGTPEQAAKRALRDGVPVTRALLEWATGMKLE